MRNPTQSACTGDEPAFYPGALLARRTVNITRNSTLTGVQYDDPLFPGVNEAVCHAEHCKGGIASPACTCGFYGYHYPTRRGDPTGHIAAVAEMTGKVTIGTKGMRAQKCEIVAVTIPTVVSRERLYRQERRSDALSDIFFALTLITILSFALFHAASSDYGLLLLAVGLACPLASVYFACSRLDAKRRRIALTRALVAENWNLYSDSPNSLHLHQFRRAYPDISIFETEREMNAAFPVRRLTVEDF